MSRALFNILKYNFYHVGLYYRAVFNSEFHYDFKNLDRIEKTPSMSNSANCINLWNLGSDFNFFPESHREAERPKRVELGKISSG